MADGLVKFWSNTKSNYNLIPVKDDNMVYFCNDTNELFKGSVSYTEAIRVVETAIPEIYAKNTLYIVLSGENAGGWVDSGSGLTKLISETSITGAESEVNLRALINADLPNTKVDKVTDATIGNIAIFSTGGSLADSTINVASLAVTMQVEDSNDYAKVYKFYQGETQLGVVNIPKDIVVKSGELEDIAENTVQQNGDYLPAGKYLVLTLNNIAGDKIYISIGDIGGGGETTYTQGDGIIISNNTISLNAVNGNGLTLGADGIKLDLATIATPGALSSTDKVKIDRVEKTYSKIKYKAVLPEGCIADYKDHEVRVLFPINFAFTAQQVGEGGDANRYYYGFKTYVPDDTVYVETAERVDLSDLTGETFEARMARGFAGIEDGRKYSITWLAAASTSDGGTTWSYFGVNSGNRKIGNNLFIKAYNNLDHSLSSLTYYDRVRVNLENETSWNTLIDWFAPIKELDPNSGLTIANGGVLGLDTNAISVAVTKPGSSEELLTIEAAINELYASAIWHTL